MPKILDACCGSRMFWFDRNNPDVIQCVVKPLALAMGSVNW